jgi:hypothetical protein
MRFLEGKTQPLGRAERTEEYVSTAKGRKRRWRHFSTLPKWTHPDARIITTTLCDFFPFQNQTGTKVPSRSQAVPCPATLS